MITHQSGEFDTLVAIERLDPAADPTYGAPSTSWIPFATWWCRVAPVTGSESYGDQAIQAKATVKMDGPYIAGVTAKMRVNDHGTFYDITSPPLIWDNRNCFMTLLGKTGVNVG